jgi:hypothetical protein
MVGAVRADDLRRAPLPSASVNTRRRTLLGSGLLVAGLIGLAAVVVLAFVLGGDPEPEPEPEPPAAEPEPEPEPEAEPEAPAPVQGEAELAEIVDLSATGTGLAHPGSSGDQAVEVNHDRVDALVAAIAEWLDAHLTDLQDGGDGLVADVGLQGPEGVGDLAGSGTVVEAASYRMSVGARGSPEWARVVVTVTAEDGGEHKATFAFTGRRDLELQAVQEGR